MTPRTEEQFEEIREQKRKLIMETAMELFAKEGFFPTSISKIAKAAKISKGLIYNYFESKDQLLEAIIDYGIQDMLEAFDPNKDGILEDEEMIQFINITMDMLRERKDFYGIYYALVTQPGVSKFIMERFEGLSQNLIKMLQEYFERKGKNEPWEEAYYFGSILDGISLNYIMDPEHYPLDKMKEHVIRQFITDEKSY